MTPIRTILHPTDFSETSGYALGVASTLAADYDANLVIVHVVAAPTLLPDGVICPEVEQGTAKLRAKLSHLEVPEDRIDVVRRQAEGNPAREILNLAQLSGADLIVIGSHGRRGLSRWLMGTVAEAVLRKATCPVLIVTSPVHRFEPYRPSFSDLVSHSS